MAKEQLIPPKAVGIVGLGLIGGALAKTIHRIHPSIRLLACDPNEESLAQALAEGIIHQGTTALTERFSHCRYIFLCAPVEKNQQYLDQIAPWLHDGCILSDTGSVKSAIHREIAARKLSPWFIGGHPMAGSEMSGYAHATAYLLENAYFLITYDQAVKRETAAEYKDFIASLGCIPFPMAPQQHDFSTAAVSHLPHILASSLVHLVKNSDDAHESMKAIAAGGFKDITRIASSSPVMWQEICSTNRAQLLLLLDHFLEFLTQTKEMIAAGDRESLLTFFREAKDYRDSLPIKKTGPLSRIYEIYCDLIDEAGGIATIATILATNAISIKNIGIIHNREFEEGVLRIEFYRNEDMEQAALLLQKHHYTVYRRD